MKIFLEWMLFVLVIGVVMVTAGCRGDEQPVEIAEEDASESFEERVDPFDVPIVEPRVDRPAGSATPPSSPVPASAGIDDGWRMPAYSARTLDGANWSLEVGRNVTMLNLWATWCGPCRYEIPALIELQEEYGEKGLQIVGVSIDSPGMQREIEKFSDKMGINYLIVHDPQAKLADLLQTTIIPTTALVDRNGVIVWSHKGIVKADDPVLLEALRVAL
jgi:cytochrome c biogenesis protein CcmG, thiol:disulfide interchange protein DsbE